MFALAAVGCTHTKPVAVPPSPPSSAGFGTFAVRIGGAQGAWVLEALARANDPAPRSVPLEVGDPSVTPNVIGDVTLGADRYVFVRTDKGASVDILKVFHWSSSELAVVTSSDGQLSVVVGGGVTHANGARCDESGIEILSGTSYDGKTWALDRQRFTLAGHMATSDPATSATIKDASDAEIAPYYAFTCGSLRYAPNGD